MTLHVPFDQFAETVKRVLRHREAYVSSTGGRTIVTASLPSEGMRVASVSAITTAEARETLTAQGLEVQPGAWEEGDGPLEGGRDAAYVAAVSYVSGDACPGVWVDAYSALPTEVQVLREMFDEFRETGEMPDVSFEEFVRLANPNVAIVSPIEVDAFVARKQGC